MCKVETCLKHGTNIFIFSFQSLVNKDVLQRPTAKAVLKSQYVRDIINSKRKSKRNELRASNKTLHSLYEKFNSLKSLLRSDSSPESQQVKALVNQMGSDFERMNVPVLSPIPSGKRRVSSTNVSKFEAEKGEDADTEVEETADTE